MSLSQDLEQIRIHQKLSREAVHSISKIAVFIIESIENGTIFDDTTNVTYQRSYIRTYAKVLKIDDADVVKALDEHLTGVYNGNLSQKYITGEMNFGNKDEAQTADQDQLKSSSEMNNETKQEVEELKETTPKPRKVISGIASDITRIPEPDQSPYNKTKAAPNVSSVNWASVNSDKRAATITKVPIIVIGFLVVMILVIFGIMQMDSIPFFGDSDKPDSPTEVVLKNEKSDDEISTDVISAETNETTQEQKADSISLNMPVEAVTSLEPAFTLPDTLSILVWAANDKLEPVRVKTDLTDSYFPYWIEKGTAMRFDFTTEISIKGQYERMMILFNNHRPMEDFKSQRGINREILLNRSLFESKIDLVKPVNETESANLPKPNKIIDRPVF